MQVRLRICVKFRYFFASLAEKVRTISQTYKSFRTVFEKNQRNLQKVEKRLRKLSAKLAKVCVKFMQTFANFVTFTLNITQACKSLRKAHEKFSNFASTYAYLQPNLQKFGYTLRKLLQVSLIFFKNGTQPFVI